MQLLAQRGVTPLAVLTEAVALVLFPTRQLRRLPSDDRLTITIGTRSLTMLILGKRYGGFCSGRNWLRYKPPTEAATPNGGGRLRLTRARLLANLTDAIGTELREEQRFLADLRKPFDATDSRSKGEKC